MTTRRDFLVTSGAALGAPGQTRVRYRPAGAPTAAWTESAWRDVDPSRDFTATFALAQLTPGTRYTVAVEDRPRADAPVTSTTAGAFVTAPHANANATATFAVMSCQQYEDRDRPDGFAIYPSMLALKPDFMVNTGDAVYYDHGPVHAINVDLARYHWARMYGFPTLRDFHRHVASFFMKDDHDTLTNDSHPEDRSGDFTFTEGLRVFREQTAPSEPPYRTLRWGRHLQVWFLEGRDFRSTSEADRKQTPTILGPTQIAWLERTLTASDATFRVVITPTPMVGPDDLKQIDNHADLSGFRHEADAFFAWLKENRIGHFTIICGDRHWQYHSIHPSGVEEFACGALNDENSRLGVAPGDKNGSDPQALIRQLYTSPTPNGGYLQITAGAELVMEHFNSRGERLYRAVK